MGQGAVDVIRPGEGVQVRGKGESGIHTISSSSAGSRKERAKKKKKVATACENFRALHALSFIILREHTLSPSAYVRKISHHFLFTSPGEQCFPSLLWAT